MRVKDVPFRWLIQRPIAIDLRENPMLYGKCRTDALVVCMWIDEEGFLQGSAVAGMSLRNDPQVISWKQELIPYGEIADCSVLPRLRPSEKEQQIIWNVRKRITADHPASKELICVRKSLYLDAYRVTGRPDAVICHAESAQGSLVLVHTDRFSGTQLLGTVVEEDSYRILRRNDPVMIYTLNSILFLDPVLIATKSRYE